MKVFMPGDLLFFTWSNHTCQKNLFIIIAIIFRKWYFQEKGFFGLLLVNVGR